MTLRSIRPWGLLPLVALLVAIPARAETVQDGALRVKVVGGLSPKTLPRTGTAPVSVTVAGRITTTDDSPPPQLQTLRIEINRRGRIDSKGLPVCPYDRIQPASSARALASCRSALVGRGRFWANIVLSGQEPYPSQGQLLVFNGRLHGRPVLYGQIYAPKPFATSFVITFSVRRVHHGRFGTVLTASLPRALGNWGYVTAIRMNLSRRYVYRGRRHSYLSAGCPAPPGFPGASFALARTSFRFSGGADLATTLNRECAAR